MKNFYFALHLLLLVMLSSCSSGNKQQPKYTLQSGAIVQQNGPVDFVPYVHYRDIPGTNLYQLHVDIPLPDGYRVNPNNSYNSSIIVDNPTDFGCETLKVRPIHIKVEKYDGANTDEHFDITLPVTTDVVFDEVNVEYSPLAGSADPPQKKKTVIHHAQMPENQEFSGNNTKNANSGNGNSGNQKNKPTAVDPGEELTFVDYHPFGTIRRVANQDYLEVKIHHPAGYVIIRKEVDNGPFDGAECPSTKYRKFEFDAVQKSGESENDYAQKFLLDSTDITNNFREIQLIVNRPSDKQPPLKTIIHHSTIPNDK